MLQVTWTGSGDSREAEGEPVGYVPPVTGKVTKRTEDGRDTAIMYRLEAPDGRGVIVSEDDLDRGTWAAKVGQERPSGMDAKQAFALVIRAEAREYAPLVTAVPYLDADGSMVLPEADTQDLGYRVTAGTEESARKVWHRIGEIAREHPATALALGAFMAGLLVGPFRLPAHILNLVGDPQQGKSTTQKVQAALYGRVEEGVLAAWDASPQAIPQMLQTARYLPLALEENSSKGESVEKTEQLMSRIVAGASRARGAADGQAVRPGRWRSLLSSSSNLSLRRPGQTEDLAARLYEIRAPFWLNQWVDHDGQPAERGPGALHLAKWVERAAEDHHGWPFEWAIKAGWYRAAGFEQLRKLHDAATFRISPDGGGLAGTIGSVYALWCTGAYLLGQAIGVDGLAQAAERAAVQLLPGALLASQAAALTPAERVWEAIASAMAKAHHFPVLNMEDRPAAIQALDNAMTERGSDVHGFHTGRGKQLWVITGKLREIADRAKVGDILHQGLAGLKDQGVLVPGDARRFPAPPPRALRTVPGLGARLYRFDLNRANEVFGLYDDDDQDPGGGGGGPAPASGDDGGPRICLGYLPGGEKCTYPLDPAVDDGTGIHPGCNPTPYGADWPAGSLGAQVAEEMRREQELIQEELPEAPEPVATLPAPRKRPEAAEERPRPASIHPLTFGGPHGAYVAAAGARKSLRTPEQTQALADRLALLDRFERELTDVPEDEYADAAAERAAKLRILDALTGTTKDPRGPFAPLRKRREPRWVPERPAIVDAARVMDGWSWQRDFAGDAVVLDRNGSWPTAVSSVSVVHGQLEHTGEIDEVAGTPAPGYYQVKVYPWTEVGVPSPLGTDRPGEKRWITATRMHLLTDLVHQGRWPDAHAYDSWTGEPVRLTDWSHLIGELRRYALETYGRDSHAYGLVKEAFGQSMGLMVGRLDENDRRRWACRSRRTDWVHAIKDQASATIWRTADKVRRLGDDCAPVAMRNVDELVIPAAALEAATAGERPAIRLDESGTTFGTWKVKGTETWGVDGGEEA